MAGFWDHCACCHSIYVCGGGTAASPNGTTDHGFYTTSIGGGASLTSLPSPARRLHACAGGAGYVHAGGGLDTSGTYISQHDQYDITSDSWTTKTSIPSPARQQCGGMHDETRWWIVAGIQSSGPTNLTQCDAYNVAGDSWSSATAMPSPARRACGFASSATKGYVFGGTDGTKYRDCEEFDTSGGTWTSLADMPAPARDALGAAYDLDSQKLFAIGGRDGSSVALKDTDEYDPVGTAWTSRTNMVNAGSFTTPGSGDGFIGAIGGSTSGVSHIDAGLQKYDVAGDSWTNTGTADRYQAASATPSI